MSIIDFIGFAFTSVSAAVITIDSITVTKAGGAGQPGGDYEE